MNTTDWLSSNTFDWIAGGLAVSLLVGSFVMMFTTIFTRRKTRNDE
ncbi:hypothetical protein IFO70_03670 [Phormidium tenue FACHB-886]|nr:hypothetical protein [Phormidium tenue FACHB-886]